MNIKKSGIIIVGIILIAFVVSIYFYPRMPEKMASHWNAQGQVDGHISKLWGLFLMPFVLVGITLLFAILPRIDPLKANIEKFRQYYDGFIILLLIFVLAIHYQMILWNLGIKVSPNAILPIGLGLLFFYAGILCENAKRNWFVGIRTPWTLSNDTVWNKTHKIGGKLFKVVGIIVFFAVFFQRHICFFIIVPVLSVAAYTVIYSYFEYKRQTRQ